MKPSEQAELRRANEELTNAYRQLEEQNKRLREQLKKRGPAPASAPTPKVIDETPGVGCIVQYIDKAGHMHNALVLEVLEDGMLRLKVFRQATPNVMLDARRGQDDKSRSCWKRRHNK